MIKAEASGVLILLLRPICDLERKLSFKEMAQTQGWFGSGRDSHIVVCNPCATRDCGFIIFSMPQAMPRCIYGTFTSRIGIIRVAKTNFITSIIVPFSDIFANCFQGDAIGCGKYS